MNALWVPSLLVSLLPGADPAAPPGPREVRGTELIVQAALDELEAPEGDVSLLSSEKLAAAFPGFLFVTANFLEADPADIPAPLAPRNVFAVSPEGEARHLGTPEDLLALFEEAFDPVKTAEDAKRAAEAALALEQAKFPDQPFEPPALEATPDGNGGFNVSGTSQPGKPRRGRPAGMGPISVNLGFGSGGKPGKVVVKNEFQPPPRRRRPVTAEDIANDTPAAQQAAGGAPVTNINSPTINKNLPGSTFFRTPGTGKKKGKGSGIVAVDPGGKATNLSEDLGLAVYVRRQFGKVTNAKDAKSIMETYLTLATGNFPLQDFAPVDESDITVTSNSDGGLTVSGKVYVKGDKSKYFFANWTFNAKGKFTGGNHGGRGGIRRS